MGCVSKMNFCDLDNISRLITVYLSLALIIPAGKAYSACLTSFTSLSICVFCGCVCLCVCVFVCAFISVHLALGLSCSLSLCLADHAVFILSVSLPVCVYVCVHGWNDHWVSCCVDHMLSSILLSFSAAFYPTWLLYLDYPCCSVLLVFSFCSEWSCFWALFYPWGFGPHGDPLQVKLVLCEKKAYRDKHTGFRWIHFATLSWNCKCHVHIFFWNHLEPKKCFTTPLCQEIKI